MSNEQKHTPGPWKQAPRRHHIMATETNAEGIKPVVATVSPRRPGWEANAQLIAAAPELLEALEKIVECERNRAKDLRHRKAWLPLKFSEERIAAAEAAIAKAKGETR